MRLSRPITIALMLGVGFASQLRAQQAPPSDSLPRPIRGRMEVVGSDGDHIGIVDKVVGNRIDVAKDGSAPDGAHQTPPLTAVTSVDNKVHLDRSARTAAQDWRPTSNKIDGTPH